MRLKLLCFIIPILLAMGNVSLPSPPKDNPSVPTQSVGIESGQIGFDGYYRPGYWCPVRIKLKTSLIPSRLGRDSAVAPFEGKLVLEIDKNSYTVPEIKMPSQAQREVVFPVLIYSTEPKILVKVYDKESLVISQGITAKVLKPSEFLIGVEKGWLSRFQMEFSRYSEAARYSRFFEFYPEDLPADWQALEAIDLLVISEETLLNPAFEHLGLWQKTGQGNLLIAQGSRIDLKGLNLTKTKRRDAPAIMPEIYQVFESPRWARLSQERFAELLGLYLLLSMIILVVYFWFRHNRWRELILWLIIIGLIGGSTVLAFLYLPPQTIATESLHLVEIKSLSNLAVQRDFISVTNLRNGPVNITFYGNNKFIRPLFNSARRPAEIPLHYSLDTAGLEIKNVVLSKSHSLIFEYKTIQPLETGSGIYHSGRAEFGNMCLWNSTDFNFLDSFTLNKNWYYEWIGKFPAGERVFHGGVVLPWEFFRKSKFTEANKRSRYQKRFLEMYLSSTPIINNSWLFIGWSETTPAKGLPEARPRDKIIKDSEEYPALWVIPIEILWK